MDTIRDQLLRKSARRYVRDLIGTGCRYDDLLVVAEEIMLEVMLTDVALKHPPRNAANLIDQAFEKALVRLAEEMKSCP